MHVGRTEALPGLPELRDSAQADPRPLPQHSTGCLRYTPYSHLPGLENGECLPHEDSFNLGFSQQLTAEGRRLAAEVGPEVVLDDLQPGDGLEISSDGRLAGAA